MSKNLRRKIAQKLLNSLDQLSLISSQGNLEDKVSSLFRCINQGKSCEDTFSIDLEKLQVANLMNGKINDSHRQKLLESIKSCYFHNKSKMVFNINFKEFSQEVLTSIFLTSQSFGFDDELYPFYLDSNNNWIKTKTKLNTLVEFSSPNIAKPLHAGHMRSTFLGNFISNIHSKFGNNVKRINYLGDWGTQYGKLAVGFTKYGSYEELNSSPMKHLLEVYVKANADESLHKDALDHFARMESNDPDLIKMWKIFKELSIEELVKTYKHLNIEFDVYESESQYFPFSKDIIKVLMDMNICKKQDDGRLEVEFDCTINDKQKKVKYIIQKSDGSTLYITRDIVAILARKRNYNFDKIVYVVDSSQSNHFSNLYQTIKKIDLTVLGDLKFEEFYVPFGKMLNMSTRKGNIEFLSDLIKESKEVALESIAKTKIKKEIDDIEQTAQTIGISHLIINDFLRPRAKDYNFTWSGMISNDSTAYSIHYAHARLFNLIERAKNEYGLVINDINEIDFGLLNAKHEIDLINLLAKYEEIVWKSYTTYEPHFIVQFLFQLVKGTNLCIKNSYVIGEEKNVALARLLLYQCTKQVIANSLNVLGINPLNRV